MSIPIGFFDFYSFMLPGILYLFVFNEASKILKFGYFDLFLLKDNLWLGVAILLFAYIVGHIMDELAYQWFRLLKLRKGSEYAYNYFKKERMSDVDFDPKSWTILLGVIRRSEPDIAKNTELHMVNSIMFRNTSFAFMLLFVVETYLAVTAGITPTITILAVACLLASIISIRMTINYDKWFYESIFEHAVTFGKTTNEVISALKDEKPVKKLTKTKNKK